MKKRQEANDGAQQWDGFQYLLLQLSRTLLLPHPTKIAWDAVVSPQHAVGFSK